MLKWLDDSGNGQFYSPSGPTSLFRAFSHYSFRTHGAKIGVQCADGVPAVRTTECLHAYVSKICSSGFCRASKVLKALNSVQGIKMVLTSLKFNVHYFRFH